MARRNLAGDDRRRHRSRQVRSPAHIGPGSPLTAQRIRQGADRHQRKAMGDPARSRRPLRDAGEVMAAGEGIETILSARQAIPHMAMAAALSAAHLAAILFPDALRRLYIVRDNDPAGDGAQDSPGRTGERGRDRGHRALAGAGGTSTRISNARHRRAPRHAGAARTAGRRPLSGSGGIVAGRDGGRPPIIMPARMRPSVGEAALGFERAIGRQPAGSAMAAADDFPAAVRSGPLSIARAKSPAFAILRCASALGASRRVGPSRPTASSP